MSAERCAGPGRVLIFWDYDTQWGADRSRSGGGVKTWGNLEFENTERLLELHAKYHWPACFAVVGAAALPGSRPYHDPEQVRRIHESGHEVASHSHRHEWLPGLGAAALKETLRSSKDALEQCIGAPVVTFVPPFNQPFDYPPALSFSLSERREAREDRTDLRRLCDALGEAGYKFCRVAYRSILERLVDRILRKSWVNRGEIEKIESIACVRINAPCGFRQTVELLDQGWLRRGGNLVVYGHPHSLHSGNEQDETWLVRFFERAAQLRRDGFIEPALPRDLIGLGFQG